MKIVSYDPKYKDDFVEMNKRWISEMFVIEQEDIRELENIEPYIQKGGQIFFAVDDDGGVMASCMIAPRPDGDWEIMKFAARGMYTGTGAGSACLKACIDYAREQCLDKVLIVSNRKCEHAVHLYRKYGFTEIPVDKEKFPFDRADIAFEQEFHYDDI
ncbi:GNAT family N-acetyltransferase [Veillonella sp. YH-vei2232]|uniref:GNAT family N-acetyltransferase n=1 Tax=Veillonella absiana TaxID=3079305 RepID=A0ABU3ZB54_9FIRM|nr:MULTISPECIES: GNAT family N-acetyltransferase [unclassified Veillonella]MDV5064267.1 GNAT family N-acetyltransferase [Veillonella sp. YH-vei2232]MDV5089149.1 GNAT family N-acetyltransferase [Veillonella sp. YH-vei2233]